MLGRTVLVALAVVVVVLTLQTTVLDRISVASIRPDLMLAIVVYFSLLKGPVHGTIAGFALGLLQDTQSHHALGLNAFAKAVTGFAVAQVPEGLAKERVATQMGVLFLAALLHNIVFLIPYTWAQISTMPALMGRIGLPGAAYTALAAPLLLAILQRVLHYRIRFNAAPRHYK